MALKRIIQIFSVMGLMALLPLPAQSTERLMGQLIQATQPHKIDTLVQKIQHQWFQQPFNWARIQSGYPQILTLLKSKHRSLYLKLLSEWNAIQDLQAPKDQHDQYRLYELLRGNLILISDKIQNQKRVTDSQKFRTYVLSELLESTPVHTQSEWPLWKSLAHVLGHEIDDLKIAETWIKKNAPHPIAMRLFPLFEYLYRENYGMEGPKQTLRSEDAVRLNQLKQQVFASVL